MIPYVIEVKHLGGCKVWLKFNDGASDEVDLSDINSNLVFLEISYSIY